MLLYFVIAGRYDHGSEMASNKFDSVRLCPFFFFFFNFCLSVQIFLKIFVLFVQKTVCGLLVVHF